VILRQDGGTTDRERAAERFLDAVAELYLSAGHFHGRQKLPVGQHLVVLRHPRNANITFDDVVKRGKVRIREWPVHVVAVAARSFEIHIA